MQEIEIQQSKACLEALLGQPVISFSYPNGSLSEDTVSIVKEAGFACACTSVRDVVWRGSNCFQLPRFWIQDWDGATFYRWLVRWLSI
jgi:peptidoglycan/xylan/chitin deacetylase (PgdA/CDA1 family)